MHICVVLGVYKKRFAGESFALFLVCKDLEFESQDMQFFDGCSALGQGSKLYRLQQTSNSHSVVHLTLYRFDSL